MGEEGDPDSRRHDDRLDTDEAKIQERLAAEKQHDEDGQATGGIGCQSRGQQGRPEQGESRGSERENAPGIHPGRVGISAKEAKNLRQAGHHGDAAEFIPEENDAVHLGDLVNTKVAAAVEEGIEPEDEHEDKNHGEAYDRVPTLCQKLGQVLLEPPEQYHGRHQNDYPTDGIPDGQVIPVVE